jgi:hypothetical protein
MDSTTEYKKLQRYREKLVKSVVGLSPHISRVSIRWSDIEKIQEWEQILKDKQKDHTIGTSPFLDDAFYVTESSDKKIVGIRFQHRDGVYKFAIYFMQSVDKIPSHPQFVFNATDIQDVDMNAKHKVVVAKFDIISNSYYPEGKEIPKAEAMVNFWMSINYFMTNFKRDMKVTTYKHQLQNKGGGRGRKYTTGEWPIPAHWHRRSVNEDFLDRKRKKMPEEEFVKKYRLSENQNPIREGKIYVDIYQDRTQGNRSEHLLSENHTGMKPKEYRI